MPRLSPLQKILSVCVFGLAPLAIAAEQNSAETALTQDARELVARFAGQLKPDLKQALQSGGPTEAIRVCAEKAPVIAENLSRETGWIVRRASHKNRNPNAQPDAWEQQRLDAFENAQAKSVASSLEYSEQTPEGFRYAKAQLTEGLCLTCHGTQIAPNTLKALNDFYPKDRARGYELGDIRGIFSLLKPAENE